MPKPKSPPRSGIDSIRHKDKRANIPTEELRDFVADEEKSPKKMLYPRDPTLDPQLVWKGKDEQDSQELAVDIVPIYIQEKIHPQAIVEDVRAQAAGKRPDAQTSLFADFNGLPFENQIEFYRHGQNWSNRMILGDSLLVMTSLAEKEGLKGKVQMIYMDPPYGIKFGSNWQVSTRKRDVKDAKIQDLTRQPEQIRAFRDTWELGIHSYLSYLRDRLSVANSLLGDTGSIFIQIGDENVHLVRSLLDEVFGSQNFVSLITLRKTGGTTGVYLPGTADYLLWYAKDAVVMKYRQLHNIRDGGADAPLYVYGEYPDGRRCKLGADDLTSLPSDVRLHRYTVLTSQRIREARTGYFPVEFDGETYYPTRGEWSTHPSGVRRLIAGNRVARTGATIGFVRYLDDFRGVPLTNTWTDLGGAVDPIYVVQTSTKIIERCMLMSTDPGDLVLDPTCGSGTTAYVSEQWGRRWITIDTSRVALALARTRLMAARYPYYLLADSKEGIHKEAEITGFPPSPTANPQNDVRKGFVYKRVPHITLKSIANNEEIDTIHARFQQQSEPLRKKLNELLGEKWEEWQIPREPAEKWPKQASKLHAEWWRLRQERQQEIDASIARRAETEFLYHDPYEDPKRIRVSGPFTVESL
ncbi:MAG: site-specific DNA-methyltransferase, partial [Planctomycetota bacterium]